MRIRINTHLLRAGLATVALAASLTSVNAQTPISGSGTSGRIAKWTGPNTQGNSVMTESGSKIGIGTATPTDKLTVAGTVRSTTGGFKFPDGTVQTTAAAGGLPAVSTDGTLTGDGTSAAPLGLRVPMTLSATGFDIPLTITSEDAAVYATSQSAYGVYGECIDDGYGVYGRSAVGVGIYGSSDTGMAGVFSGDVAVFGTLSKAGGSFKIDHPLDPENKYLSHSFVESPDMMNIYNGNITLDARGEAVVELPDYFTALNRDFRYQLTSIGGFSPVYVAEKVANNRFKIAGGKADMEVSWQVTGIRQDAWANAHRIPNEEEKVGKDRGRFMHPEELGQPREKRIEMAHRPATNRQQP
jgi:trimeric autotransporter adhesin